MPKSKPKVVLPPPQGSQSKFGSDNQLWSKEHSMLPPKQHETFCKLLDLFSPAYETDVIQAVGESCSFKCNFVYIIIIFKKN